MPSPPKFRKPVQEKHHATVFARLNRMQMNSLCCLDVQMRDHVNPAASLGRAMLTFTGFQTRANVRIDQVALLFRQHGPPTLLSVREITRHGPTFTDTLGPGDDPSRRSAADPATDRNPPDDSGANRSGQASRATQPSSEAARLRHGRFH